MRAVFTPSRRTHLTHLAQNAAIVAFPALLPSFAFAQTALRPTPSQSEGPFYPDQQLQDADFDLLRNGAQNYTAAQAAWVRGQVTDTQGKPVKGAVVEIWQCDYEGTYRHSRSSGSTLMAFQGFGRVQAGTDGRYAFRTIKPVPYPGRPPHIHFKVKLANRELLTTQMYIAGDQANGQDFLMRGLAASEKSALEAVFGRGAAGWQTEFNLVVRG